ncbi:tumor protein D53 isoform X1 [Mauremys mutica]|uniref:tumor protein D53 isoform X1 n=2 Tax=Mauremys mutica TaxID=74926 RepID=UPI001D168041|nr:tumor protein D53 isoform X1 [Mauremys mutica]
MEAQQAQGLLETQPLHETDEETVTDIDFTSMISEEEREELKIELAKLEDEVSTLRQVLAAKEKHLAEIKQKLGINLMNELKQNFSKSWHDMQTTSAYKKTHETLSHAGQKATAAISNVGTAISKKFGDMRNSPTFKSFEEKVETTVTSLKLSQTRQADPALQHVSANETKDYMGLTPWRQRTRSPFNYNHFPKQSLG